MESASQSNKIKVALIGATGAIGKEIVRAAKNDPRLEELCLVVRKRLDEWKDEDFKCKLKIIAMDNFDDMEPLKEQLKGYDSLICTLGTRVKVGEELFKKVDYHYPIEFAKVGVACGAHFYGLLSSHGAKASSWFLYMKTKGEVERDIAKVGVPQLNIYRPGLLLNRDNDERIGEKIGAFIPFLSKIESSDVGKVMLDQAIKASQAKTTGSKLLTNDELVQYARSIRD